MVIISDRGTHFVNATIQTLMKNFMIDHMNTITYHPQENGVVKSFNKTLRKGLTKVCNLDKDD